MSNRICPNVWNTKLGDIYLTRSMQKVLFDSLSEP